MNAAAAAAAATSSKYCGNLQERLRGLSERTNCPTRQENGQRYLGPPSNWVGKPPHNAEIFLTNLPADCFEDEIYDFCCQAGQIYLIRLMINFSDQNRGFCYVTYVTSREAHIAIHVLPQKQLRKGLYLHAEISLNNCTLKMDGLRFELEEDKLEQVSKEERREEKEKSTAGTGTSVMDIRSHADGVLNVVIRRNHEKRTMSATLYFESHQKAAVTRRKLHQIATTKWGPSVRVLLWSKKSDRTGVASDIQRRQYSIRRPPISTRCNDTVGSSCLRPVLSSPTSTSESDSPPSIVSESDSLSPGNSSPSRFHNRYEPCINDPFTPPHVLISHHPRRNTHYHLTTQSELRMDPFVNWNTDMFNLPRNELKSQLHLCEEDPHRDVHQRIEQIIQEALHTLETNVNLLERREFR